MPDIQFIRLLEQPPAESGWQECRRFPNPVFPVDAVFDNPDEFRMGCYAWRLRLLDRETKNLIADFEKPQKNLPTTFLLFADDQPWVCAGERLFLRSCDCKGYYYYWQQQKFIPAILPEWVMNFQASWTLPRAVIQTQTNAYLIDTQDTIITQPDIKFLPHEHNCVFWLKKAPLFFFLSHRQAFQPSQLHFFEGLHGHREVSLDIDPDRLIPYDQAAYQDIKRDYWSLLVGQGVRCVGYGLDRWMRELFHPDTNELFLQIYRPIGPVESYEGQPAVRVKEVWALFQIRA